jgi:Holliday junction resolvase RusA-like endonuclease
VRLAFEVNIKPVAQGRPRFFVRKRGLSYRVGAYDPNKSRTFKEVIAWNAKRAAMERGLREPTKAPIVIGLIFGMGQGKASFHTKRPDIDNLAKAVKDALQGVIYADDSQIVEAHLYKQYGDHSVKINIQTLEGA